MLQVPLLIWPIFAHCIDPRCAVAIGGKADVTLMSSTGRE